MAIKKRPQSPRQKMINLMYVVLMAMLALNVSTEVLNGFSLVEESLHRTTDNSATQNAAIYSDFEEQMKANPAKVKEWFEKAQQVKRMSDSLYTMADELKLAIAQEADGSDADVHNLRNKEDLEAANQVMLSPTEGRGEALKKASLDSAQITFYSWNEEVHNKLVGAPRYRETVSGIENALKAGINLSINTPLCTLNKDYVKTLQFLHEKGVTYVTCSGLITTGNAALEASENLQLSLAEIREILKESVEYCYKNGMEISFTSPGWVDESFCAELGINTPNCGACLSNMAITPGGNVVPCQSWLSDAPLGNFLKEDWNTIWDGAACRERREFSSKMRCECPLRIYRGKAGAEQ